MLLRSIFNHIVAFAISAKFSLTSYAELPISTARPVSDIPKTAAGADFSSIQSTIVRQQASLETSFKTRLFKITNPERVSDPSVDAGYGVKRYGAKFLYGHSTLAFNRLKTLYEGDRFVVEMDGQTVTYQVSRRVVLSKAALDASSSLRSAIYGAAYRGQAYDLALMTCGDGTNDDESSRLILFVSRV